MSAAPIRVWAPSARAVEVVVSEVGRHGDGATRHPMVSESGGWWSWTPSESPVDYLFSLDGGDPRPDPRSAWQPEGVHGVSRTFEASTFEWSDAGWRGPRSGAGVLGGVVYELHIGTFTSEGTFDAAALHLDHLVSLGVDVVEVMPVSAFGGTHGWGYDGVAPYAVQDVYGGPAAFQRFVDACHVRGLGVCLDAVYNHLGPTGNYLGEFGPYFTERHSTPWGAAVNLDADGSAEVRRWIVDNALRWFADFHVDALRLDAVHELRDDSERHVVAQLSDEVNELGARLRRPLDLIAESDLNDPVMVTPTAQGGRGMDAQWDDDLHHALHVVLTGETQGYYSDFAGDNDSWPTGGPLSVLAKAMSDGFLHDGRWSSFREKEWGAPVDKSVTSGHRFLAYLQTHDQVGNRATGDRIGDSITPGQQAVGAALYLLSPYTAMVFMGEEWRASTPFQFFTSFEEEELAEAVRSGRRGEFASHGWDESQVPDPQSPSTREASVLRWGEVSGDGHRQMLEFYRTLIGLRRTEPDIASGDLTAVDVRADDDARWFVLRRGSIVVVANLAEQAQVVPFDGAGAEVVASWGDDPGVEPEGLRLDGHDVAVLRVLRS
ncbi:malto-oligosyltrehalose trehalohydrolase [Terracoccus luteus]|uniref:Malto-oligosyltrehalose trehalohydrolase n=1 Tax=Terracoccus luteus TaxID=53356 RepID=A0A839PRS6_9MICO|nr:malto-oligosyltrehalose trehalohydrolase [Terracoccus luteus]MBB2986978.1 maltooligosyltrehalose trehalohydrolase [Terracoccus luteus]MCP2172629.1 maltooligosyltrehalose trehalohydrolase [Terracoccus luteus]